MFDCGIHMVSA